MDKHASTTLSMQEGISYGKQISQNFVFSWGSSLSYSRVTLDIKSFRSRTASRELWTSDYNSKCRTDFRHNRLERVAFFVLHGVSASSTQLYCVEKPSCGLHKKEGSLGFQDECFCWHQSLNK